MKVSRNMKYFRNMKIFQIHENILGDLLMLLLLGWRLLLLLRSWKRLGRH